MSSTFPQKILLLLNIWGYVSPYTRVFLKQWQNQVLLVKTLVSLKYKARTLKHCWLGRCIFMKLISQNKSTLRILQLEVCWSIWKWSVLWDEGEWNAEASRGERENVADHTPTLPSHSCPAHVRLSLHCSVAVSESRWLQDQPSQALHYFSGVQQVRLLLWITFMLPPALACCCLWEPRRSRHRAPRSVSEAASLSKQTRLWQLNSSP